MPSLEKTIEKFALANAYEHEGKAQLGPIIGKLIASNAIKTEQIGLIKPRIQKIISVVNRLSLEEQEKKLKEIYPDFFKKKREERGLKELPKAKVGKVVTRIPPEPSKYDHIGHALSFLINYLYAKKYKGKCVLRFEDTNPTTSKKEYVDAIREDVLDYLGIKPNKIVFSSNDLPKMYKYAEQLIKKSKAYVCFCNREYMQRLRHEGKACKCRKTTPKENLTYWKNILNKFYKEGEAVLRLKIDMRADNQVMRDPVIFRISYDPHYLQKRKYCCWPMYDFANALEDEWCGVSHILRSAEFGEMRIELQNYIKKLFEFRQQEIFQYGRFEVAGAITQGREIRRLIEESKITGWDDPSLVTLRALKRRGIVKETYYDLAIKVGLSKTPTKIDWSLLSSINRSFVDKVANRYFFVPNPVKLEVRNAPKKIVKLKLHPDKPKKGFRKLRINSHFFITKDDAVELKKGQVLRLKDLHKIKILKTKPLVAQFYKDQSLDPKTKKIQWVPAKENMKVEVLMPDAKITKGLAEKTVKKLKVGDIIQFERFAFCKLEKKINDKLIFCFGHR